MVKSIIKPNDIQYKETKKPLKLREKLIQQLEQKLMGEYLKA